MPLKSNALIGRLVEDDLIFVRSSSTEVDMPARCILQEAGRPVEHVYFPSAGSVSFLVTSKAGAVVEAGFVGADGAIGSLHQLGSRLHFTRAIVVVPGRALRLPVLRFETLLRNSWSFNRMIVSNNTLIAERSQQIAACNLVHRLELRLCRWLLQTIGGGSSRRVEITQEALSHFLGVNRARLNEALKTLEIAGAVAASTRGTIQILSHEAMQRMACECAGHLSLVPT